MRRKHNFMKEIELKILNIDVKKITKKIFGLGGKRILPTTLAAEEFFDFSDFRLEKKMDLLRLRKMGKKSYLTLKLLREKKKYRVADEFEIEVNDFRATEKILLGLGFICFKHREKRRTSYRLGKIILEIDEYPQIPPYLELEGSKKDIDKWLKLLCLEDKKTTNMTASEVIEFYKKDPTNLKF